VKLKTTRHDNMPNEQDSLLGGAERTDVIFSLDPEGIPAALASFWWLFIFRSFVMIIFGLICIFSPDLTLLILTYMFAWFMIFDGIACVGNLFGYQWGTSTNSWNRASVPPGIYMLNGICDFIIAVYAFMHPDVTEALLLLLIATWFLFTGVMEVVMALFMRRELTTQSEWFIGTAGVISVVFGIVMLTRPGFGVAALEAFIGIVSLILGSQFMYVGLKLRDVDVAMKYSSQRDLHADV
jgi:uncharacterized membrane protein HdeD (DUF308 family)